MRLPYALLKQFIPPEKPLPDFRRKRSLILPEKPRWANLCRSSAKQRSVSPMTAEPCTYPLLRVERGYAYSVPPILRQPPPYLPNGVFSMTRCPVLPVSKEYVPKGQKSVCIKYRLLPLLQKWKKCLQYSKYICSGNIPYCLQLFQQYH